MTPFFKKFNRAAKAAAKSIADEKKISTYQLLGKEINCQHCGGKEFDVSSALLNTAGMTFLKLDWANRSASVLACRNCGHVQWYLTAPEKVKVTYRSH